MSKYTDVKQSDNFWFVLAAMDYQRQVAHKQYKFNVDGHAVAVHNLCNACFCDAGWPPAPGYTILVVL